MKTKQLRVMTPQGLSGMLQKESRFVFNYQTTDRRCEASLVMPIRAESYSSGRLFSVFEMNRPEGFLLDVIRQRFAKQLQMDDMALLRITGGNQIGRLRYIEPEAMTEVRHEAKVSRQELIASKASDELFEFLVDTYFASGISGFQPKVLVPDSQSSVTEKTSLTTSDLIVKSAGDDYPFLAQNEFLCMEVARIADIDVPDFWLSEDGKLFIMSRFDVQKNQQMGLEDMAVLMGKSSEEKYQGSYEGIARAIDIFCGSNSPESKQRLFGYVALSCLVRNGDAHLKNFALLYDTPNADVRLSPLYDVVTTTVYEIVNSRTEATRTDRTLALNLNKSKAYPLLEEIVKFGEATCLVRRPREVIERIQDAKAEVCRLHADRIDVAFLKKVKREWGLDTFVPKVAKKPSSPGKAAKKRAIQIS